ncbi:hypothetical protein EYF80_040143 [Liparis tanakae]|uniref:Uncharacterized protein n=1 Tax=Liparis tanakae TaxID=230148 RepID=A0A4Z2G7T0_9TELE|nr:hypothetical protein EYF80_040143 [Liparis tanakae]
MSSYINGSGKHQRPLCSSTFPSLKQETIRYGENKMRKKEKNKLPCFFPPHAGHLPIAASSKEL